MSIGIPYAKHIQFQDGSWGAMCPACLLVIELKERKDFESFTGREYANHYKEQHGKQGGENIE